MQEEEFQKKLQSLQIGCIVFGVLQLISIISSLNSVGTGRTGGLLLGILILLAIIGTYYYTNKKNSLGPILEYALGVLLILDGVVWCITIIIAIIGILSIIGGVAVIKNANWFQQYIDGITKNASPNSNVVVDQNGNPVVNVDPNVYANPNVNVNPNPTQNPNAYTNPKRSSLPCFLPYHQ